MEAVLSRDNVFFLFYKISSRKLQTQFTRIKKNNYISQKYLEAVLALPMSLVILGRKSKMERGGCALEFDSGARTPGT